MTAAIHRGEDGFLDATITIDGIYSDYEIEEIRLTLERLGLTVEAGEIQEQLDLIAVEETKER